MNLTHSQKAELNALSKEVFGASSRWQKLVDRGSLELVTESVTEYVPNAEDDSKEGTTREVQVPVLHKGIKVQRIKRHTVESIKETMLNMKAQRAALQEQLRLLQEEQAKQKANEEQAKKVHEELGGSAIG